MSFTSVLFICFVLFFVFLYYIVPKNVQWIVLLIASLLFYISNSAVISLLMIFTTILVYFGGGSIQRYNDKFESKKKELDKEERKKYKADIKKKKNTIIAIEIALLITFVLLTKYPDIVVSSANSIVNIFCEDIVFSTYTILMPLGISYYTLMCIGYLIDVSRKTIKAEKNPMRLMLYVCYFPHIVEGPFDSYKDLDKQFRAPHILTLEKFKAASLLVLYGLFEKMVIADRVGPMVSSIFKIDDINGTSVIVGALLYTFQLYLDFAGYIHIGMGVSELFDVKITENFRQPFCSKSINEFWQRWHISLGAWLKNYVFYPVSLSSHFKKVNNFAKEHIKNEYFTQAIPAAYALLFVWLCNGLWHGFRPIYIVYGLYYYVLMTFGQFIKPITDNICSKLKLNVESKPYYVFERIRTFLIVVFGMLIFRSGNLSKAINYIKIIFTSCGISQFLKLLNHGNFTAGYMAIALLGFLVVLSVGFIRERNPQIREIILNKNFAIRYIIFGFLLIAIIIAGVYGAENGEGAAIYGQF